MYSYEERLRAVELYIKLGKRLKAVIRQLGYPTKNSLREALIYSQYAVSPNRAS
jgi:transposase-like protein